MQIYRFEKEGKLKPRRERPTGHCRVWYDAEEVERLAEEWKPKRKRRRGPNGESKLSERGKIAAKALPMFAAGCRDLAKICAATEADPTLIQELFEEWRLGVEGLEKKRVMKEERESMRRYEQKQRLETYRDFKLRLAQIESKKREA